MKWNEILLESVYSGISDYADKLARIAAGKYTDLIEYKIGKDIYLFDYSIPESIFRVHKKNDISFYEDYALRFNTRKLADAKKMLKEWLNN